MTWISRIQLDTFPNSSWFLTPPKNHPESLVCQVGKQRQGASQLEMEQSPNLIYVLSTVPGYPLNILKLSLSPSLSSHWCLAFLKQSCAARATRVARGNLKWLFAHTLTSSQKSVCLQNLSPYLSAPSSGSQPNPSSRLPPVHMS